MNSKQFNQMLDQLRSDLNDAKQLRAEFERFKSSFNLDAAQHVNSTKTVISSLLERAQVKYADELRELREHRAFMEKVQTSDRVALESLMNEQAQGFPTLATAYADYLALRDEELAHHLGKKPHPAVKAAEAVREITQTKRELEKQCRMLRYVLLYYENLFPEMADYREEHSQAEPEDHVDEGEDPAKAWLSLDEYRSRPSAEKYQLALDRYWKRNKSPWQLGRDYERYVGYLHEQKGYDVTYQGIIEGLEDCGRDLICRKGDEHVIVQCKYWSQHKLIHEKHVNQLFGTCVEYWIGHNAPKDEQLDFFPDILRTHKIIPRFVTSTRLSDRAERFARALGVHIVNNCLLKPYPCIKCNIARDTSEYIYHLPFDQQYDNTVIEPERGEFYAMTVADAEDRGFRRAFRWRGSE